MLSNGFRVFAPAFHQTIFLAQMGGSAYQNTFIHRILLGLDFRAKNDILNAPLLAKTEWDRKK